MITKNFYDQSRDQSLTVELNGSLSVDQILALRQGMKAQNDADDAIVIDVPQMEAEGQTDASRVQETESGTLLSQLAPIFYNDQDVAATFLHAIQGMSAVEVTDKVAMMVQAGKIGEKSSRKPLWTILNENGLYNRSVSNWNKALG